MRSWYLMRDGKVVAMLFGDDVARAIPYTMNLYNDGHRWTVGWVDEYGGYLPREEPIPSRRHFGPYTQPEASGDAMA